MPEEISRRFPRFVPGALVLLCALRAAAVGYVDVSINGLSPDPITIAAGDYSVVWTAEDDYGYVIASDTGFWTALELDNAGDSGLCHL